MESVWGPKSDVTRKLKDEAPVLQAAFREAGSTTDDAITPSRSAWLRRHPANDIPAHVRDEFQISTKGFVSILLYYSVASRGEKKQRMRVLAHVFLSKFVDHGGILAMGVAQPSEEIAQRCQHRGADPLCHHLRNAISGAMGAVGVDPAEVALRLAGAILPLTERCAAAEGYYHRMVCALSGHIEKQASDLGSADPLVVPCVVLGDGPRKRRMDEDLKRAVVSTAMGAKRAKTVGAMVRATGMVAEKTAAAWVGPHMTEYMCACRLSFAKARTLSLSFDATRVGCPKEETLACAAYAVDLDIAAWLPPQALQWRGERASPSPPPGPGNMNTIYKHGLWPIRPLTAKRLGMGSADRL